MMSLKLRLVFFLSIFQFSICQSQELIHGKVLNQNLPVKDVEIINFNTKVQTNSDHFGNFSIAANTNDLLVFIAKDYYLKRVVVNEKFQDKNSFSVILDLKAEELKEVVVTKMKSITLSKDQKYEQAKLDNIDVEKRGSKLNTGVYDGSIANGLDIPRILGMIVGLFAKDGQKSKEALPEIVFAVKAKEMYAQKFYLEQLKLKPEEIELFLQFCDVDPKSKGIVEENNRLSMMDFLYIKNNEFKKLAPTTY